MASSWPPKKNTAFTLYFTLYKNDGTIIANPGTITKKVSIDGAAVADITAAVTEEDTTYGQCSVVLAAGEMNGDAIWVYIKDDTAGCVPLTCTLYTAGQTLDEVKTETASILEDTGTTIPGTLTTIDGIVDDILVDTAVIGALGAGLTGIPWNAAWDAEVQSECTDALNAYDPPTNAEMELRTLPAASYFDPATDAVANVTLVGTCTTNTDMVAAAPSAATIADAVWDEAATGHTDAGKAGAQMWTDIDAIAVDVAGLDGAAMRGTDSAALASVCTEGRLAELDAANLVADVAAVKADTAAILTDTAEIGTAGAGLTALPAPAGMALDATVAKEATLTAGVTVTTNNDKTGYALSAAGVDAILDDAPAAELSSIPTTTGTLRQMVQFLFQYFRNQRSVTSTTETLYKDDAATALGTATLADNGTTVTKGEMS